MKEYESGATKMSEQLKALENGWATDFGLDNPTEELLVAKTLERYEAAMRYVFSKMEKAKLDKYIRLVQLDIEYVTLGRLRKILREAGYGISQHLGDVDIFSKNPDVNLASIWNKEVIPECLPFMSENALNNDVITAEKDGTLRLNCRDFLDRNVIEYASDLNYIRTLNIYCALEKVIRFATAEPRNGGEEMKELELKEQGKIKRLTNKTFKFDERINDGWFSAVYFLKTAKIAEKHRTQERVTMQFFQRKHAILCGIDEAIAILHTFARNPETLEIAALHDGDKIEPFETVLTITGHYQQFGHLEGLIDGILARRTAVATNVHDVVKAVGKKDVVFMGDRDDHFSQQAGDGYAAYVGGMSAQATHAMNEWWGKEGLGTMPHALIQLFEGDVVAAAIAYKETYPEDNLIALVDYNNDVISDTLALARHFGKELVGVRIDTSPTMVDQYFMRHQEVLGYFDPRGMNSELVFALREALDQEGFHHVKIFVSGGLSVEKIELFERIGTPVDTYGVGASLLKVNIGFTGDAVLLNGKPEAKAGRRYRPNDRLEIVEYI